MADAMRSGDRDRRDVLRLLLAAIQQDEVDQQVTLDDDGVMAVLMKQAKQRRESIEDATKAGRPDLATSEQGELRIIEDYLPRMMTAEEVRVEAEQVIQALGASGVQDMGQVMGPLMARLKGKADGKLVSQVVRDLLRS